MIFGGGQRPINDKYIWPLRLFVLHLQGASIRMEFTPGLNGRLDILLTRRKRFVFGSPLKFRQNFARANDSR